MEPVIAPGMGLAPGISLQNHNESFLAGPMELKTEELEAVIVPGVRPKHNESFVVAKSCCQARAC